MAVPGCISCRHCLSTAMIVLGVVQKRKQRSLSNRSADYQGQRHLPLVWGSLHHHFTHLRVI